MWRGASEKSVVAAELAPDLCSAHVASKSLPRERGKGKYSTHERGSHRLLVVPPASSLMLAYVLPPVESSRRQNNRTITQYTADDILAQLWHVTGKEKKHWIYSFLKTLC